MSANDDTDTQQEKSSSSSEDLGLEEGAEELSVESDQLPETRPDLLLTLQLDRDSGVDVSPVTGRGIEFRRPSIVETIFQSGALSGTKGGHRSGEINVDNISALDLEQMYQTYRGGLPTDDHLLQENGLPSSVGNNTFSSTEELESNDYTPRCDPCHWWEPHFNSPILERHWKKKVIEFLQRRYRIALIFIGLFSLLWLVFFSVQLPVTPIDKNEVELTSDWLAIQSVQYSEGYIIGAVILFIIMIVLLILTFWKHYSKIAQVLSVVLAVVLMGFSGALAIALHLNNNVIGISTISFVAQFAITAAVVLVVYMFSKLNMWLSVVLCAVYIVILEVLASTLNGVVDSQFPASFNNLTDSNQDTNFTHIFIASSLSRLFFHVCLNIAGITTAYLSHIRLHDTFWRIGQCVLAQKVINSERDIEEKTIHSMMPRLFAEELLSTKVQIAYIIDQEINAGMDDVARTISIPFTTCSMDRVSILFADIVGFTNISACLSAVELVGMLNKIFSEFDELALKTKCEKIATLGDCYFCVSGCPKPEAAHADNCVEMGLSIIKSLEDYRLQAPYPIHMRIGVHTGSVMCGVMGTKRFKFDVWSRDVTLANLIESICEPDRVLISSSTKTYLSFMFATQEAVNLPKLPELSQFKLYYATRCHSNTLSVGSTTVAWKQRIRNIDSISKGNEPEPILTGLQNSEGQSRSLRDLLRRRSSLPIPTEFDETQPSNSLRDSLSRQSRLQHCTSYTEFANGDQQHVLDKKIVQLMEEQGVNLDSYFDPRLHFLTASFGNRDLEARYRNYGRDVVDPRKGTMMENELGFKLAKLSYLIDVVSLLLIFILIMVGSAINLSSGSAFTSGKDPLYKSWLTIFIIGLVLEIIILIFVIAIFAPKRFPKRFASHAPIFINWYVKSFVALFLIYFPMTIVIVSLIQCYGSGFNSLEDLIHVQMSFYITIVVLISSINFMEVSYIAKMIGGVCSAGLTVLLVSGIHLKVCATKLEFENSTAVFVNRTLELDTQHEILKNYYNRHVTPEAVILLLLILSLLVVVNKMSEVSVRLSFIGRIEAAAKKQFTQQQKNQVEWLLYTIIPPHVAMELRKTGRYSCNHECVGVIFASIVNFSDFSCQRSENEEDSFRVLNQIIREFDTLLNKPCYSHVEKIKTIGSTYMAVSGLNVSRKVHPIQHLVQLVDYALKIGDVLRQINALVPGFTFLLRIGFNYGPVTSGAVGSRKLMYDVWGDTVNVASRMDTTGQVFKIQMPEICLRLLSPVIRWEMNREINIKGKGPMKTVFITGRR